MDAIFGGSFDPVHLGHLIVAEAAAEALAPARLRFLPARQQPFKSGRHVASPEQRAEMLELAAAGNPLFRVDRTELEREGPSYTVETLRRLAAKEPGNRPTLLIGADVAGLLADWYEVESLPGLADIVVFARAGVTVPRHPLIRRTVEVPAVEISATMVRERVQAGRSIRYLVPDAVREYIAAHGLYR
ncbi:MAG: nicotinate (nicotinamide) nucleotide adenylyltransferase [Gemmatimonadales bacterium]